MNAARQCESRALKAEDPVRKPKAQRPTRSAKAEARSPKSEAERSAQAQWCPSQTGNARPVMGYPFLGTLRLGTPQLRPSSFELRTSFGLRLSSGFRGLRRRGFTLIELLLATAIFAIVLVSINTVFFAALRLRRATTRALDESRPLNNTLAILRRDLQNAVPPGGVLAGSFRYGGLNQGFSSMSSANNASSSSAASTVAANSATAQLGGLDFFTATGSLKEEAPWGAIQEVNYRLTSPLDPSKALGKDIVRSVSRNLLAVASQTPEEQRLASNIEALDFSFWDGSQWRDAWDSTTGDTNLPLAVRVSVHLAVDPSISTAKQEPVEMVVLLDAQPAISSDETNTTSEETQ